MLSIAVVLSPPLILGFCVFGVPVCLSVPAAQTEPEARVTVPPPQGHGHGHGHGGGGGGFTEPMPLDGVVRFLRDVQSALGEDVDDPNERETLSHLVKVGGLRTPEPR